MVVQHQDFRVAANLVAEMPSRRQPGEAAADHHEIVLAIRAAFWPRPASATHHQAVRHLKGPRMAAAHPRQGRRVVSDRRIRSAAALFRQGGKWAQAQGPCRQGQRKPVQKVPPGDPVIHWLSLSRLVLAN